jgi:hypothetical protein
MKEAWFNEETLDRLRRATFAYFRNEANPNNGVVWPTQGPNVMMIRTTVRGCSGV